MAVCIVTGSGGLIGAATVRRFAGEGLDIVGIDNDMRAYFFGPDASTRWSVDSPRTVRRVKSATSPSRYVGSSRARQTPTARQTTG